MAGANDILNTFNAIAQVAARLTPIIDHIPNSIGGWVPPLKNALKTNEKLVAGMAAGGAAAKAMQGRLGALAAVMGGFDARTAGATKRQAILGTVGGYALSKIIRHFKDAGSEAHTLETKAQSAGRGIAAIGAKAAKMGAEMHKATRGSGGGNGTFLGINKNLLAFGAVAGIAANAAEHFKGAFDLGSQLNDLQSKTGIAADQMLILGQAAKDNGLDDVSGSVNKMQKSLVDATRNGADPAAAALALLGLKAADLVSKSPVDEIQAIGAALRTVKSPEIRTSVARDIFGKSGPEILPLLDDPKALDTAQRSIGIQAALLAANSGRFDAVSDRLNRAGLKMQGFFVGIAATVLPLMEAATARFDSLDLASQGQRFGEGVKTAVNFLAGGFANPSALFSVSLKFLEGGFLQAGNVLIAGIRAGMSQVFQPSTWRSLAGIGQIMQAAMVRAFANSISYLTAAIEMAMEKLPESLGGKKSAFAEAQAKLPALLKRQQELNAVLPAVRERARQDPSPMNLARRDFLERDAVTNRAEIKQASIIPADESLTARAARLRTTGALGSINALADAVQEHGQKELKDGARAFFSNVAGAVKNFKVPDILGAGPLLQAAGTKAAAMTAQGSAIVAGITAAPAAAAAPIDPFAKFRNFATFGVSALTNSSGFGTNSLASGILPGMQGPTLSGRPLGSLLNFAHVANLATATPTTPLLSARERGAFENIRVAQGGTRTGTTEGAFEVVRRGDAARRKAATKDAAKEEEKRLGSIQLSNQHLAIIAGASAKTADASQRTASTLEDWDR